MELGLGLGAIAAPSLAVRLRVRGHGRALVGGDDMAHARARTVELGAEGGDAAVGHAWARGGIGVRGAAQGMG